MGHLKNKYTKEYYTGKDAKGNQLKYGATSSLDENGNYILREHDESILKKIDFKEKNVLALGCGRGEELVYAIENGANTKNSVGVDFSSEAIKIAKKLFDDKKLDSPVFYTDDALDFVINYITKVKGNKSKKFDIVIMFDFVEHVPREELIKVLDGLKNLLGKRSILVINTPAYKYDNDVIKNGCDERNQIESFDTSDLVPETQGMHCNKYSLISLQEFMNKEGFINITEAHYFVDKNQVPLNFEYSSYYHRWNVCKENGFSIFSEYTDDIIEFPYPKNVDLKLIRFEEGVLEGISLFLTEEYKKIAYPMGNMDTQMMEDILTMNPIGKTIFDVGTFVGASALVFSKFVGKEGKVIGFEPNPFNRNRSFLNLSHNPSLAQKISIYPYALGKDNRNEKMVLSSEIDSGYSSTSRLKGSHSTLRDSELPSGFEEVVVEVKTLDTFVRESQEVPDIIKVDIEGAEYDFLLGALETIKKYRPIFYIEIHSEFCAIRCFEILRSEGYSVTIINEEPDNRIMIKAEYIDVEKKKKDSIEVRELQIQRNQDATFNLLKSITSFIEPIKKDLIILQNENQNLEKKRLEFEEKNSTLEKRILELEGENSTLEKRNLELKEKNSTLEKRNLELEEKNSALEKRNLELEEKNSTLEKRILELEGENSTLEKKILELGREILRLSTDNVKLKEVISSMEESRSWRITKPLRSVKHVLKKSK